MSKESGLSTKSLVIGLIVLAAIISIVFIVQSAGLLVPAGKMMGLIQGSGNDFNTEKQGGDILGQERSNGNYLPDIDTCNCKKIKVYCGIPEDIEKICGDNSACAFPSDCAMYFRPLEGNICRICIGIDNCNIIGSGDDAVEIPYEDVRKAFDCTNTDIITNPEKGKSCCLIVHEIEHLCQDPRLGKCDEYDAENAQLACNTEVVNTFCSGDPALWSDDYCRAMCWYSQNNVYIRQWDRCMCISTGASYNDCCNCLKSCIELEIGKDDDVDDGMPQLCAEKGWIYDNMGEKLCKHYSTVGHDCSEHYGGPDNFDPEKCPKTTLTGCQENPYPVCGNAEKACAKAGVWDPKEKTCNWIGSICNGNDYIIDDRDCSDNSGCFSGTKPVGCYNRFCKCCEGPLLTTYTGIYDFIDCDGKCDTNNGRCGSSNPVDECRPKKVCSKECSPGVDAYCDGKEVGEACGTGRICSSDCMCKIDCPTGTGYQEYTAGGLTECFPWPNYLCDEIGARAYGEAIAHQRCWNEGKRLVDHHLTVFKLGDCCGEDCCLDGTCSGGDSNGGPSITPVCETPCDENDPDCKMRCPPKKICSGNAGIVGGCFKCE